MIAAITKPLTQFVWWNYLIVQEFSRSYRLNEETYINQQSNFFMLPDNDITAMWRYQCAVATCEAYVSVFQ